MQHWMYKVQIVDHFYYLMYRCIILFSDEARDMNQVCFT